MQLTLPKERPSYTPKANITTTLQWTSSNAVLLSLRPSDQDKIFTCNDTVKGTVRVRDSTNPRRVTIKFRGEARCRTHHDERVNANHEADIELFSHELDLRKTGLSGMDARGYRTHSDYAFEFQFPETVQNASRFRREAKLEADPLFESSEGYLLPPSFASKQSHTRIVYYLEAELFGDYTPVFDKPKIRRELRFLPSVYLEPSSNHLSTFSQPYVQLPPVHVRHQTRFLHHPIHKLRQQSHLERFKNSLHRDKPEDPWASFSIAISAPAQIRLQEAISLRFSLIHYDRSENLSDPPFIALRAIQAQSMARIYTRVPVPDDDNGVAHEVHEAEPISLFYRRFDEPKELFDGMKFWNLGYRPIVDEDVPPGFSSSCITLRHHVKFILTCECAGKTFTVEAQRNDFPILPMRRLYDVPLTEPSPREAAPVSSLATGALQSEAHFPGPAGIDSDSDPPPPYSP